MADKSMGMDGSATGAMPGQFLLFEVEGYEGVSLIGVDVLEVAEVVAEGGYVGGGYLSVPKAVGTGVEGVLSKAAVNVQSGKLSEGVSGSVVSGVLRGGVVPSRRSAPQVCRVVVPRRRSAPPGDTTKGGLPRQCAAEAVCPRRAMGVPITGKLPQGTLQEGTPPRGGVRVLGFGMVRDLDPMVVVDIGGALGAPPAGVCPARGVEGSGGVDAEKYQSKGVWVCLKDRGVRLGIVGARAVDLVGGEVRRVEGLSGMFSGIVEVEAQVGGGRAEIAMILDVRYLREVIVRKEGGTSTGVLQDVVGELCGVGGRVG